jgi:predicted secreted Zn-dependent protease
VVFCKCQKVILAFATAALPVCAHAQTTVVWKTNHYTVGGATVQAIHQSLRYFRPWKNTFNHDAQTQWRVEWNFSLIPSGNSCRLGSMTTGATILTILPRWTPPTNVTDEVRNVWKQYSAALAEHESGHGQFAISAAAEMQKRVPEEANADVDCATLRAKINSLCQKILDEHRGREKEYDKRTRHGAAQGAVLRGRMRERPDRPK